MSLLLGIMGNAWGKALAIHFLEREGAVSYRIAGGPEEVTSLLVNSQYPPGEVIEDIEKRENWRSQQYAPASCTQGALLQKIQTGMQATVHRDVWVELALEKAAKSKIALITDLRFANEIAALKRHGGILLRVDAPKDFLRHPLDRGCGPDLVIEHSGTTEELEQKILSALELKVS